MKMSFSNVNAGFRLPVQQMAMNLISSIAIILGGLVLIGRIVHLPVSEIFTAANNMVANAALGFILAGLGLLFLNAETGLSQPKIRIVSHLCAGSVFALAALTLIEDLFNLDLGIDELLVPPEPETLASPPRMAPMSALNFALLGGVILLRQWRPRLELVLTEIAAVILLGTSGLALLGYVFNPETLYHLSLYTSMSLLTALLFILLALGILLSTPQLNLKTLGYGLTFVAVAATFKFYLTVKSWSGASLPPFVLYYSVIVMASLLAGLGPGLLALVLSAFVVVIWVFEPVGYFVVDAPINQIGLTVFFCNGLLINLVVYLYRHNRQKVMIYERQQAEEALRAMRLRNQLLGDLVLKSSQPVGIGNSEGSIEMVNPAFEELTGYTEQELKGLNWRMNLTPLEWHESERAILAELNRTGKPIRYEKEYLRKDGTRVPVELLIHLALDAETRQPQYYAFVTDITQRKRIEKALQDSEARYRQLIELIPVAVYTCDATGVITFFNELAVELWGRQPRIGDPEEKFCGSYRLHHTNGNYLPREQTPVMEVLAKGKSFRNYDIIIERPDGSRINALVNIDPILDSAGKTVGVINAFTNITERRQREMALHQKAEEVERLLEVVPAAVWVAHDPFCSNITGNLRANELFGAVSGENVSASTVSEVRRFYSPDGRELAPEELPMQVAAATNKEVREFEIEVRHATGRKISLIGNAIPLRNELGEVRGAIGSFVDITGRKQSENALKEKEERLRLALDAGKMGTWDWFIDSGLAVWNDEHYRLLGYGPGSVQSGYETWANSLHPEDRAVAEAQLRRCLEQGDDYSAEFRVVWPDGSIHWLEAKGRFERDTHGKMLRCYGVNVDITAHKHSEAHLFATKQRLEALMTALPVGVSFSEDITCQRITGNPAVLAQFEVTPDENISASAPEAEAIGRQVRFFLDGRLIADNELPLQRAVAEKREIPAMELEVLFPNGRRLYLSASGAPIYDQEGRIMGGVAVTLDITQRKQAEKELQRSEQRYRTLVGVTSTINWSCQPTGMQTEVQPEWMAFTGQTTEEILGQGWAMTLHPDDSAPAKKRWMEALTNGEQFFNVHRIRRYDGEWRWMEVHAVPVRDDSGVIVEWAGMNLDITERKQAELALRESQQQLALTLEAGKLGFWDWDIPTGRVQFGGQWAAMLGYELSEIEPHVQAWERLVHPDEKETIMATLSDHLEGRSEFYECEHRMRHKNGSWKWILDRGQVVARDANGRPLRAVGTHADITVRREAEIALQEADRQKNEFLAMLGHELRNPLTPISNLAQTIGTIPLTGTAIAKASEMLTRNVNHISRMIDDLLDVSRITRGLVTIDRQPIELGKLLKDTVESIQPVFKAKQQVLILHLPIPLAYVDADPVRLTQVFSNLLNNATKYTGKGGRIDLGMTTEGQSVVVRVQDNGRGIKPELLPHVFGLFTQGEQSLARSEGGLGLGLTLVKKLVELHGGEITAASKGTNQGSEFVVTLPTHVEASAEVEPVHSTEIEKETKQGLRILIIDDNEDVLDSVSLWLEMEGHQVMTANHGIKGISIAQNFTPDIILLDNGLPEMDGYQVAKKLREQPESQKTVIVAMSGYCPDQNNTGKDVSDFNQYLLKPPKLSELRELILKCQLAKQGKGEAPTITESSN